MSTAWETALVVWMAAQLPLGLLLGAVLGAGPEDEPVIDRGRPEIAPSLI